MNRKRKNFAKTFRRKNLLNLLNKFRSSCRKLLKRLPKKSLNRLYRTRSQLTLSDCTNCDERCHR